MYQTLMLSEYNTRKAANKAYSLRAFARDIGLSPSQLVRVLKGQAGLSKGKALQLCQKFTLSSNESNYFIESVMAQSARSRKEREASLGKLKEIRKNSRVMQESEFNSLSSWLAFAIMELSKLQSFKGDSSWISRVLGVHKEEVELVFNFLLDKKYLIKKGQRYVESKKNIFVESTYPSSSIKNFHMNVLARAQNALHKQALAQREFSSLLITIDPENLPELKTKIQELVAEFNDFAESLGDKRKKLYALGMQFFEVTENMEDL